MTTYCYSNLKGGNVFEHSCKMGKAPATLTIAGVTLHRDFKAEQGGKWGRKDWYNHWSMSLGVTDPATGTAFKKKCAAAGVAEPKFRMGDSGQVLVENERHAKQLRALHPSGPMVDFAAYY
ncbi:MAG TPA: hypothetical protein VJL29_14585 [Thermoguttaceae bacterium]|nr:hypothetical protein [Thermoguttaceae bacterium]